MRHAFKFLSLLGLILALGVPAGAQGNKALILKAPFNFVVEEQHLPAGTYRVVVEHGWLQIRSEDRQKALAVLTLPVYGKTPEGAGQVMFHRCAGRYFLSQVWVPGMEAGRQALESRDERELRKHEKLQAVLIPLENQTDR